VKVIKMDLSEFRLVKESNPFYEFEKWFWKLPRPQFEEDVIDQIVFGGVEDVMFSN
jgi:hypothetical protein